MIVYTYNKALLVLGLQRGGESRCVALIDSNVAEPIWTKLSGVLEDRVQNVLAKDFFENFEK